MKRLEQDGFHIPQSADGRIELSFRVLSAILSGIKPRRYYKRYVEKSGIKAKKMNRLEIERFPGIFCIHYEITGNYTPR